MIVTHKKESWETSCGAEILTGEAHSARVRMTWAELGELLVKAGLVREGFVLDHVRLEGDHAHPTTMRYVEITMEKEARR